MWVQYLIDTHFYPARKYMRVGPYSMPDVVGSEKGENMPSECETFFPTTTLCPW